MDTNAHGSIRVHIPCRILRTTLCMRLLALTAMLIPYALAQRGTGELRLSVKDATGAGVAATVELSNQSTQTLVSVNLPADVRYSFKNLPFGFYRLLVTHAGFSP